MTKTTAALAAAVTAALLAAPASAGVVTRDVERKVDGETLEIHEAFDDAASVPRPGVLVFHHTLEGVNRYIKAETARLAAEGWVVMAPSLAAPKEFGGKIDARDLGPEQHARYAQQVARRAKAALAAIKADPRVDKTRVAIVGFCHLGAPAAMTLARNDGDFAGVVGLWGGVNPKDLWPMWTRRKIKPKILLLLGGRDVETNPYLQTIQEELRVSGADWRLNVYGSASHAFTIPGVHPDGRGEYDAEATRLAWRDATVFLKELFAGPGPAAP